MKTLTSKFMYESYSICFCFFAFLHNVTTPDNQDETLSKIKKLYENFNKQIHVGISFFFIIFYIMPLCQTIHHPNCLTPFVLFFYILYNTTSAVKIKKNFIETLTNIFICDFYAVCFILLFIFCIIRHVLQQIIMQKCLIFNQVGQSDV